MVLWRGGSPAGVCAVGPVCILMAACGSSLSKPPAERQDLPPSVDGATSGPSSAADAGAPVDADASFGHPDSASGGTADAAGPPLAPFPPATCSDTSWAPAVPGHATVNSCGGQLPLSSTLTTNGATPPNFHRCGTLGPEIETDLRLSPDGARLATLTGAGTVRLFATDEWREIAQLAPQVGRVDAFAFSPDGTLLATLSTERGELTVWNAADGTPRTTFTGRATEGGVPVAEAALAFSRDGRRIASSLGAIVDLGGRSAVTLNLEQGPEAYVEHMAFTMCDAKLYVRSYSQTGDSYASTDVALYDTQTGLVQWVGGGASFGGSALSQDGRLLAVAGGPYVNSGYSLSIYRGDTGERVAYQPDWRGGGIQAFTPDGTALLLLNGTELDQWRIADGTVVTSTFFGTGYQLLGFPAAEAIMVSTPTGAETLSLSPSYHPSGSPHFGATAASWTADGTAGAAIATDGSLFHVWHEPDEVDVCAPTAPGPTAAATSFGLSGDGRVLGVGKADGVIDLFDTATGSRRGAIETLQGSVATTALSWDGTTAAARTAAFDAPVQLWSTDGSTLNSVLLTVAGSPSMWSQFVLSPDAHTIAANDGLGSTALIDVTTGAVQPVQPWAAGAPFSPDSTHLVGWVGALATWHVPDAVRDDVLLAPADLAPANPSTTAVNVGLASDWSLAAALSGTSLLVWDPRTGVELWKGGGVQSGAPASILGVAGSTVAVNQFLTHTFWADYDVTNLYDVQTGAELRTFGGYSERAGWSLLLGPDGSRAYTLEPPDVITWCR